MITLKMISEKISAWLRNMHEWFQFSDLELCPIRSRRSDIEDVVRRLGPRRANALRRRLSQYAENTPASRLDSGITSGSRRNKQPGRKCRKSKRRSNNTSLPRFPATRRRRRMSRGNQFQVLNMMIWNAAIYWTLVVPGYRYRWQR
jgi:hypothetical protein